MKNSVIEIPFNRHLGLVAAEDPTALLELPEGPQYLNHMARFMPGHSFLSPMPRAVNFSCDNSVPSLASYPW